MEQQCYNFYCDKLEVYIGSGFCCFTCKFFKRPDDFSEMKKCKFERVVDEFVKDV